MTRVEQGIIVNSQHQYNVLNNIPEEVSFRDQILALGYKDIEEFFEEKTIYDMQKMLKNNISSVRMDNLVPVLMDAINNQKYGIISIYTDTTCVCHGQNTAKQLNKEYCAQNNIPIYPYNSFGGNIVATKEDYGIAILLPSNIDMSNVLLIENVKNMLSKYFENVSIEGNDILINDKKVVGSGSFGNDKIFVMLFYFSMSDKGDLIYNICGEPVTNKTPGYINTNILPSETLKGELSLWLQGL